MMLSILKKRERPAGDILAGTSIIIRNLKLCQQAHTL